MTAEVQDWLRFFDGDPGAAERLTRRYQPVLRGLLKRLGASTDDAEDACQEAFLRAYRTRPSLERGSLRGWLCRVARNAWYDRLRRTSMREVLTGEPLETVVAAAAEEEAITAQELARVALEARSLTQREREVIEMELRGHERDEIAVELGIGRNVVRVHRHNAVRKLREALLGKEGVQ